jgi:hypothetical protein
MSNQIILPSPNRATARVVDAVATHLHLEPEQVFSPDRHSSVALARQIVMYVLREHQKPQPSFPELARELGRDHSTVMYAVRRVTALAEKDEYVRDAIDVGRSALASMDVGLEVRRLTLLREREACLRKARRLDEKLDELGVDPWIQARVGATE